ncbi:hypothetical protein PENSPDRAFT_148701 [Peniophora sp. CONT]|nr:hypothetical protein PENSPDRAFT_148701 [Peniophora sp. CONT]
MPKQPSAKTKRQHLPAPGGIHDHFATVVSVPDGAGLESLRGPAKAGVKNVILSAEQQHVYNLVVHQAQSIFFTGSAGTGKSLLLRAIIAGLRRRYKDVAGGVAVLSTTGMAASNIGDRALLGRYSSCQRQSFV